MNIWKSRVCNSAFSLTKKLGFIAFVSLLSTSPAYAGTLDNVRPYLGVAVGHLILDNGSYPANYSNFKTRVSTVAYTVKGGIIIGDYVGVELRTVTSGDADTAGLINTTATSLNYKLDTLFAIMLKLQTPYVNSGRAYVLVGGSNAKLKTSVVDAAGLITTTTSNQNGASYGLGLAYDTPYQISFEAELMKYPSKVTAINLFATYRF